MRTKLESVLCGVAGEYFVAAELTRRGYIASITLRNTRGIDILASKPDGTRTVAIQVKTSQKAARQWILSAKNEHAPDEEIPDNLFYVFVILPRTGQPSYYVISRREVARLTTEAHARWLATPGKGGRTHRDSTIRNFADAEERYRDNWSALGLD